MEFWVLLIIFALSFFTYQFVTSYRFQVLLSKRRIKAQFLGKFIPQVKGVFFDEAYYSSSHKIVTPKEFQNMTPNNRAQFSKCFSAVTFKTTESSWELYFYLVKDGIKYTEVLVLRTFPKDLKIRSEGFAERAHSRVNVLTNNRYLTQILEGAEVKELLRWVLRHTGDSLYVNHNNISFRAVQTKTQRVSADRAMEVVKGIHNIKNRIYKKGILEY